MNRKIKNKRTKISLEHSRGLYERAENKIRYTHIYRKKHKSEWQGNWSDRACKTVAFAEPSITRESLVKIEREYNTSMHHS